MNNNIFVFTLHTSHKFEVFDSIFTADGSPVGRILKKYPTFKDRYEEFEYDGSYDYDVESSEENYLDLCNGKIKLDIEKYSINTTSTYYTHEA